jgi:hypothetical protein
VRAQLPVQIHLLTVQENLPYGGAGQLLFRLDHSFELNEDPVYSQPVTLQLNQLFTHISIDSCTEMSLTANQPVRCYVYPMLTAFLMFVSMYFQLANVDRFVWALNSTEPAPGPSPFQRSAEQIKADSTSLTVTINPMEIRTWSCNFHRV